MKRVCLLLQIGILCLLMCLKYVSRILRHISKHSSIHMFRAHCHICPTHQGYFFANKSIFYKTIKYLCTLDLFRIFF